MDEKYDPVFKEIRECLQSEELDAQICKKWKEEYFERSFENISKGYMAFSELQCDLNELMSPLYYCQYIGIRMDLERCSWGAFLRLPEQGVRFMEELRLYREGQDPVSEKGLPWLFRSEKDPHKETGERKEASPEQKRKLFRCFEITEQLPFAGRYLHPPAGCAYPRLMRSPILSNNGGIILSLRFQLPKGVKLESLPGQTVSMSQPDGSAAVLTILNLPPDSIGQMDAVGYVENYTRTDPLEHFKLMQSFTTGDVNVGWYAAPGEANNDFCLHDPTLPHWAPFIAWYEKEQSILLRKSWEKMRQKQKALLEELYRITVEE